MYLYLVPYLNVQLNVKLLLIKMRSQKYRHISYLRTCYATLLAVENRNSFRARTSPEE